MQDPGESGGGGRREEGGLRRRKGVERVGPCVGLARGEGGAHTWHLCQTLTPGPGLVGLAWASQICTSDFAGAEPRSPIGPVGAYPRVRGKYPFTPKRPAASSYTAHSTDLPVQTQDRVL